MKYSYAAHGYYDNAEATFETNEFEIAFDEFVEYMKEGILCDIVDCTTGEVLVIANTEMLGIEYISPTFNDWPIFFQAFM